MDRCICCGRELDYEGTLVCWECAKFVGTDLPLEENSKNIVANAQ